MSRSYFNEKGNGYYKSGKFRVPRPTRSEIRVRKLLEERQIPFEHSKIVCYTTNLCYTPDLIVGGNLIVEVDGKIHDQSWKLTPDRIRQRALEMMGFVVIRVRNEEVESYPEAVSDKIVEKFYTVTGVSIKNKVTPFTATQIRKNRLDWKERKKIEKNLVKQINLLELTPGDFSQRVDSLYPGISSSPTDVEEIMLSAWGWAMRASEQDKECIDYEFAARNFQKAIDISSKILGENAKLELINLLLISAPGFIKNLVFQGGPNINTGVVHISNSGQLIKNLDEFNYAFQRFGINVELNHVLDECNARLKKGDLGNSFAWIKEIN